MIQLFIDYATNKIIGYNTILPEDTKDLILVEDYHMAKLPGISIFDNLYYENGEIVEKENPDDLYIELKEITIEEQRAIENVKKEYRIFMDNIVNGMSMKEAASITESNRKKLEEIKKRKEAFESRHQKKMQEAITLQFENEEKEIQNDYFLSIVAVVRDENDYLEEWMTYHIEQMGVDHIYLYDNESLLPVKEYLESVNFKYLGKLTIQEWKTSNHTQQDTCNHWLKNYGHETKWFIVMDVDEFVTLKETGKKLREFLQENSGYTSIQCPWKHYTAGGQESKTNAPVMERFTVETDWGEEKHGGKYFAQSNRICTFTSYVPNARFHVSCMDYDHRKVQEFFQLNHYLTKSYEEWLEKLARGSVNPHFMRKYQEFFEINPDMAHLNQGDTLIQRYGMRTPVDQKNVLPKTL